MLKNTALGEVTMVLGVLETLVGFTVILTVLYYYSTSSYNFWKSRGVTGPRPVFFFGTIKDILLSRLSIGSYLKKIYDEYRDEPMVGIYARGEPILVLHDMELIKTILIKDFSYFVDRGLGVDEKHEPLSAHLFSLDAERWRLMRPKLSPAYTSGKLREMFYLLRQCAERLDGYLANLDGESVDVRELAARFTTDVIGVCAFGVEANAMADEASVFREMGKRIFSKKFRNTFRFRVRTFAPTVYSWIGHWLVDQKLQDFFINLARDTMEHRKKNNITRHDFIDQLKELKEATSKIGELELTDSLMAAQLFVFFIAGFETSSSTISNCLFELAMNHNIRDKLREEIGNSLEKTNGEITYEGIKEMQYLDRVIKETLRKYPPITSIMRKSTAPYTFPGTKVSIPSGTRVWIPIFGIQRDAKYFPNPEVFDPDRFTEEVVKSRPQMAFLSFGDGPRNCIGARFGSMQTKVGLVKILQNCTVDVCADTDKGYAINQKAFLLAPENGVYVKIIKSPIG